MKKVLISVGTRPNFIKITRFKEVAKKYPNLEIKIVHTGQHFDKNMSGIFFKQFNLQPDFFLELEGRDPNSQISEIMQKMGVLIDDYQPDLLIVPGDVNSTLAAAITANKKGVKLAHLEAGLRSNDREMPEEINRILTDELADFLFITEKSGEENLIKENKKGERFFVGNTMIDTLVAFEDEIHKSTVIKELGIEDWPYVLMTIHRPSNVDNLDKLNQIGDLIQELSERYKIVFPIHPRTKNNITKFGLEEKFKNKNLISPSPMGYFEFQKLIKNCSFVLTDSGGIQEETTFRKVPCLTLRDNTERPVTVQEGSNTLVPLNAVKILQFVEEIENGKYDLGGQPSLWDGKATERILDLLSEKL